MPVILAKKKKKKQRNLVLDWLGYALVRALLFILYLFPVRYNLRFACFLGNLMWKYYHRGRQRAMDNLGASFPEKDDAWRCDIGRRSFQHIVMLVIDLLFTPRLVRKDNWRQYARVIGIERAKWMMQEGKGLLMLTGHYGNFEIIGYALGLFGFNIYSIARPLDNRFINDYLYSVRQRNGQKIIDKKGAADLMVDLAEQGATLCFIADQDAGRKGVFVDFFGRKASSYKSIGLLALQYNKPIVIGVCRQVPGEFFFEIEVGRIIEPSEWAHQENPLQWITQEYNRSLEELIRKDPSQYWWVHRRWKTRPKEERAAAGSESTA
ncbi:MAG: lysophospholipid acyltransferase family protein [Planctomycetaceae bacterium]|nr:lysophospholipid acyltransferase family protein [Planctomycetaceae bacterium]